MQSLYEKSKGENTENVGYLFRGGRLLRLLFWEASVWLSSPSLCAKSTPDIRVQFRYDNFLAVSQIGGEKAQSRRCGQSKSKSWPVI